MLVQRSVAASLRRREFFRLPASGNAAVIFNPRHFSSGDFGNGGRSNAFDSVDEFEKRFFGSNNNSERADPFFQKLERIEKSYNRSGFESKTNSGSFPGFLNGLRDSFDTLSDGMDMKLNKAAQKFVYNEEIEQDDYCYRPDVTFRPGTTYTTRDLDVTKPGIQRTFKRAEFETTTKEVLKKADFRNVRFLANFLTEAGIIIKRSQTRISAKAQRKVAREIKIARAFGLMPFTCMGTKPFAFGKMMKDQESDFYPKRSRYETDSLPDGANDAEEVVEA